MLHTILLGSPPASNLSYEIVAPLDRDGCLDARRWQENPEVCTVRRQRPGEAARTGRLRFDRDRTGHALWFIRFDDGASDEPCYRIGAARIRRGDPVAVRDPVSAAMQTFEVRAVRRAPG